MYWCDTFPGIAHITISTWKCLQGLQVEFHLCKGAFLLLPATPSVTQQRVKWYFRMVWGAAVRRGTGRMNWKCHSVWERHLWTQLCKNNTNANKYACIQSFGGVKTFCVCVCASIKINIFWLLRNRSGRQQYSNLTQTSTVHPIEYGKTLIHLTFIALLSIITTFQISFTSFPLSSNFIFSHPMWKFHDKLPQCSSKCLWFFFLLI